MAILLIDDERYMLRSLRRLLEREGYEVETASTGEAGAPPGSRAQAAARLPGRHAARHARLRGLPDHQARPGPDWTQVVMLSARARPVDRDHARQVGADGYLAKPCSPTQVVLSARRAVAC